MQSNDQKPATVRIENKMAHALDVPIPGPGKSILRTVRLPKATPQGGPGIYEGQDFDALTLNRLRFHYDWRPNDVKQVGKRKREFTPDQITEIGLLAITVLPDTTEKKSTKAA
jgi:hypothetical protein